MRKFSDVDLLLCALVVVIAGIAIFWRTVFGFSDWLYGSLAWLVNTTVGLM